MLSSRRAGRRFSLLLLDEGEAYVKDFVAHCTWPAEVPGNWQRGGGAVPGQLRLCTKSLFFEPDDIRIPIVRLPFAHLQGLEGGAGHSVAASAQRVVRMKPGARDVPYAVDKDAASSWAFELAYAGLEEFMPLAQQMLVASRLPPAEQEEFLEAFLVQQEAGLAFDAAHLRSPSLEHLAAELPATLLSPLVREPGRAAVSDARLYFQPQHNVGGDTPIYSHPLAAVAAVARRRSALRDVGLEVFFLQPEPGSNMAGPFWGAPSAFLAFRTRAEREEFVAALAAQSALGGALPGGRRVAAACGSILEAEGSWLSRVTAAWQRGHISNFQYLMFCNLAAGRSFNDLTQYPVFPWVLSDYGGEALDLNDPRSFRDLSRPVGALNPVRLAMFQRRYAEMAHDPIDPPFLYGTHYSCPGYVMFWLVRAAPAHMLRLQNGRFDAPDRLFCSVGSSWESVLANPTDVKELIPEFFMHRPDFLLNRHALPLGSRQNGKPVGDVELPPWAGGSPDRFLELHRAALEAPFVSANLHHWINLIFGYQQRGPAAVDANNLFRHITYEGAVDTEAITNRLERISLQTQVNEFGQCPRQLFRRPHPPRLVCPPLPETGDAPGSAAAAAAAGGGGAGGTAPVATVGGDGGGQALSLALVSAILAAASESEGPPQLEVPALLQQLDVVRQREEQEARELREHGPIVSRATVIVEDFRPGPSAGNHLASSARPSSADLGAAGDAAGSPAAGAAAAGKGSAYIGRFRSWAQDTRLGERLGAIKGALGEAVGAPPGEKASAIRGLFKRGGAGGGGGSSSSLGSAGNSHPAGSHSVQGGQRGEPSEGEEAVGPRVHSASAAEGPTSPGGGRVSSFTAGLSNRWHSLTSARASPSVQRPMSTEGDAQRGAVGAGLGTAGSAGGTTSGEVGTERDDLEAGHDVLAGLMRWKTGSARQPLPEDSSDEDSSDREAWQQQQQEQQQPGQHVLNSGSSTAVHLAGEGPGAGVQQLGTAATTSDVPAALAQQPLSPTQKLLESQRQRMLRTREGAADSMEPAAGPAMAGVAAAAEVGVPACMQLSSRWGPGLSDRLRPGRVFAAGSEAVSAVALAATGSTCAVYAAGHSGTLKLFNLYSGDQLRSSRICSQPLTSLALLPSPPFSSTSSSSDPAAPPSLSTAAPAFSSSSSSASASTLPVALCGSYDSHVYAYSADHGRVAGSFQAHNDAVSCLAWLGGGAAGGVAAAGGALLQQQMAGGLSTAPSNCGAGLRLVTGSWDASVRVWDLGDVRHPWGSGAPSAGAGAGSAALVTSLTDIPGGVWALACSSDGNLLLAGTEDGHVLAWDLRSGSRAWEQAASQDYIGGLALTPDAAFAVVAAADGTLQLLDTRKGGAALSCVACGPPLRCVATDGELALAGAEDGTVYIWDVAQQRGRAPVGGTLSPPGPDGLYAEPLRSSPPSPVNALAAGWVHAGAAGAELHLVTGHEGGVVRSYTALPVGSRPLP